MNKKKNGQLPDTGEAKWEPFLFSIFYMICEDLIPQYRYVLN